MPSNGAFGLTFRESRPKAAQKVTWVLKLIEETQIVPKEYFKKLTPYDIWEVRISFSGNKYRILSAAEVDIRLI